MCIECGCNAHTANDDATSPIFSAIKVGNVEIVKALAQYSSREYPLQLVLPSTYLLTTYILDLIFRIVTY